MRADGRRPGADMEQLFSIYFYNVVYRVFISASTAVKRLSRGLSRSFIDFVTEDKSC